MIGRIVVAAVIIGGATVSGGAAYAVCADADGNGSVSVTDGVIVLRAAAGLATECTPAACDVDGSGAITVTDGVHTLRAAAGLPIPCTAQPTIEILGLEASDTVVRGRVTNADPQTTFVVGWARTDRYYVQPRSDAPFTTITDDGSWQYATNPWQQVVVLLVDRSYVVPSGPNIDYHPKSDPGVLAFAEVPASARVAFSGSTWDVKSSEPFATEPGPCVFSSANVRVDEAGRAHLSIVRRNGRSTCAELVNDRSLGYGAYAFQIDGPVDALPPPSVLGLFTFESLTRELDIELSRFLAGPWNAQFVVQPYQTPGNRFRFDLPATIRTSHRILWRPDRVAFASWNGWDPFPPSAENLVASFTYTGPDIPPPGNERVRLNLWLAGDLPAGVPQLEVVLQSFAHDPAATE
ncbi:MAG: hypothetical protein ABI080_13295 [Candidatus Binatia bacterium]